MFVSYMTLLFQRMAVRVDIFVIYIRKNLKVRLLMEY